MPLPMLPVDSGGVLPATMDILQQIYKFATPPVDTNCHGLRFDSAVMQRRHDGFNDRNKAVWLVELDVQVPAINATTGSGNVAKPLDAGKNRILQIADRTRQRSIPIDEYLVRWFQNDLSPNARAAGHTFDAMLNRTESIEQPRTVMTRSCSGVKVKVCQAWSARQ